jgi:hypothetical protein
MSHSGRICAAETNSVDEIFGSTWRDIEGFGEALLQPLEIGASEASERSTSSGGDLVGERRAEPRYGR